MNAQFWWYVARSGGVVAWGLAALSVLWGLLVSSRVLGPRSDARKLLDLHRFLGGLTVVFAAIHGLGLVLADELALGVVDLLVPMAAAEQPGALAVGIVAFYLLLAVEITSLLRGRVGERVWQYVHYAGFGVFLFGTIHGLRVGTDVDNPLIWWPAAIASAAVVGLCAYRIFAGDPVAVEPRSPRQDPVPASLLERTLSQLEQLDTSSYPAAVPPAVGPRPHFPPLSQAEIRASAATGARPPVEPALPIFPGRTGFDAAAPAPPEAPSQPPAQAPSPAHVPTQPPAPTRAPFETPHDERPLPTRVPQRLSATTAPAAGLGSWAPAPSTTGSADAGPPPPPDGAVDPATGEPDPAAYRKWLRDWLQYVESQP